MSKQSVSGGKRRPPRRGPGGGERGNRKITKRSQIVPEDPKAMEKHQRLMETAESVVKLSESLTPRRPPSQD